VGYQGTGKFNQTGGSNSTPSLTINNNYSITGGSLTVSSYTELGTTGKLSVANAVANLGQVSNYGDISILGMTGGNSAGMVDAVYFTQATSSTELDIDLGGAGAGSGYGAVNVTANASLNGILDVTVENGFQPFAGEMFDIIEGGSRTGTFTSVVVPSGSDIVVTYTATGVELTAVPEPCELGLLVGISGMLLSRRRRRASGTR
jgi:hypothetical protein